MSDCVNSQLPASFCLSSHAVEANPKSLLMLESMTFGVGEVQCFGTLRTTMRSQPYLAGSSEDPTL